MAERSRSSSDGAQPASHRASWAAEVFTAAGIVSVVAGCSLFNYGIALIVLGLALVLIGTRGVAP